MKIVILIVFNFADIAIIIMSALPVNEYFLSSIVIIIGIIVIGIIFFKIIIAMIVFNVAIITVEVRLTN